MHEPSDYRACFLPLTRGPLTLDFARAGCELSVHLLAHWHFILILCTVPFLLPIVTKVTTRSTPFRPTVGVLSFPTLIPPPSFSLPVPTHQCRHYKAQQQRPDIHKTHPVTHFFRPFFCLSVRPSLPPSLTHSPQDVPCRRRSRRSRSKSIRPWQSECTCREMVGRTRGCQAGR